MSDWLNDNLAFGDGEDFNKLSDTPRENTPDADDGLPPCKTDRKSVAKWLMLIAELIPQLPNGTSLKMQNTARMARNLAKKLTKNCQ